MLPMSSCACCARPIEEDAPIYMRRDKTYCSKDCRKQAPSREKSPFSRAAYKGEESLQAQAAMRVRRPKKNESFGDLASCLGSSPSGVQRAEASEVRGSQWVSEACSRGCAVMAAEETRAVEQNKKTTSEPQGCDSCESKCCTALSEASTSLPSPWNSEGSDGDEQQPPCGQWEQNFTEGFRWQSSESSSGKEQFGGKGWTMDSEATLDMAHVREALCCL